MGQVIADQRLRALVERLQAESKSQEGETFAYFGRRAQAGDLDWNAFDDDANRFLADKLVALDPLKAEFCWQICRMLRARRVVEAGTSYGVSTLYLADAVRRNVREEGGSGEVIATEYEPGKAAAARANFAEARLADMIDLREGDLRETLKRIAGPVDFMLIDIWTPMARPALELVAPHLRPGAAVVCDNTAQFPEAYRDYFAFLRDPASRFTTMTLPFEGGLELSVRTG